MKKDNSKRGGMLNAYGWRPGEPPKRAPDLPSFENAHFLIYTYKTTRDAVEAVLPEPLEPGPNPFVAILVADFPAWYAFDTVANIYNEVQILVECQYKGEVGLNLPFMYAGTNVGDFTMGSDIPIIVGREIMGFPKKLANIYINRVGDEWVATMARKGTRLLNFRAKFEGPMKPSDSPTARYKRCFLPKEILSAVSMGYDVRQLIAMDIDFLGNNGDFKSCLKGTGSVELGEICGDPLATLKVVEPGIAIDMVQDIRAPQPDKMPKILATDW